jgi:ubiquitin carboxyl-terminal hydrolase 14
MGDSTATTSTSISAPSSGLNPNLAQFTEGWDEDDEDWYKFDDDKVSVFPKEKLATLDGGGGRSFFLFLCPCVDACFVHLGEDSSAYVLLYRTKAI